MNWWKAAMVRCLKTAAETALAVIGTNAIGITEVDWLGVLSAAALGAVVCFLTCLAGLPEVEDVEAGDGGVEWHPEASDVPPMHMGERPQDGWGGVEGPEVFDGAGVGEAKGRTVAVVLTGTMTFEGGDEA